MNSVSRLSLVAMVAIVGIAAVHAGFTPYIIRNGSTTSTAPQILNNDDYVTGALEFVINEGGMKAGLGTNDINGSTIGDILSLSITRYDDTGIFAPGSGPAVAPYFNIWVTDGLGNYAVIANEPSNPIYTDPLNPLFHPNGDGSRTYDLSYSTLSAQTLKVYETTGAGVGGAPSWIEVMFGTELLTFEDIASLKIEAPDVQYILDGNGVGGGAPDELGTNIAYGFNWVFGDTMANYVSGQSEGYVVSNASVSAVVPIPAAAPLGLLGMGLIGLARKLRKKSA